MVKAYVEITLRQASQLAADWLMFARAYPDAWLCTPHCVQTACFLHLIACLAQDRVCVTVTCVQAAQQVCKDVDTMYIFMAFCGLGAALTASLAGRQGEVYACCNLGVLYYRQRQYDEALTYCERFFEAARGLNDQRILDVARVNLGAVRAALTFQDYVQVCCCFPWRRVINSSCMKPSVMMRLEQYA